MNESVFCAGRRTGTVGGMIVDIGHAVEIWGRVRRVLMAGEILLW